MNIYFDRIKPLFENSGLTDKEIENILHLPRGVIYKWGTGKYKSYMKYIPQIADFFQVTPNYLLGKIDDPTPVSELTGEGQKETAHQTVSGHSAYDASVLNWFYSLPPEKRQAILNLGDAPKELLEGPDHEQF